MIRFLEVKTNAELTLLNIERIEGIQITCSDVDNRFYLVFTCQHLSVHEIYESLHLAQLRISEVLNFINLRLPLGEKT
jgi:hypothetical protein